MLYIISFIVGAFFGIGIGVVLQCWIQVQKAIDEAKYTSWQEEQNTRNRAK